MGHIRIINTATVVFHDHKNRRRLAADAAGIDTDVPVVFHCFNRIANNIHKCIRNHRHVHVHHRNLLGFHFHINLLVLNNFFTQRNRALQ